MAYSVGSNSPSRAGTASLSPLRAPSPKQWQESFLETNYRPVLIDVNTKRVSTAPPENFEQLSFLEKLMYTGKTSPSKLSKIPTKTGSNFKLEVISPEKQKPSVGYGHESTIVMKPSRDHLDAFKTGVDQSPPLKIIKHVKVGVKLPKMPSGNTPSNICRNYAGGFYATS